MSRICLHPKSQNQGAVDSASALVYLMLYSLLYLMLYSGQCCAGASVCVCVCVCVCGEFARFVWPLTSGSVQADPQASVFVLLY